MAVFDETPETPVSPVADLVGEGKKFKTIDDLAKSKIEADSFIETLKAELVAERAKVKTQAEMEDTIRALSAPKAPPAPLAQTERVENKAPDLSTAIKAELDALDRSKVIRNNIETVTNRLVEVYGSEEKAGEVVRARAVELGVSTKFLMDSASTSPKAFYAQIGLDETRLAPAPAPRGEINPEAFRRSNTSQYAPGSYEHIRDSVAGKDVKKLLDPNYLNASMKAALENPDKFFANQTA